MKEYLRNYVKPFLRGDLERYDPKKLPNKVLADDVRILAAWWATGAKDKDTIVLLLRKVLTEIARRKRRGQMNWTLHLDKVKDPDLFRRALRGIPQVAKVLFQDFDIIRP